MRVNFLKVLENNGPGSMANEKSVKPQVSAATDYESHNTDY